LDTKFIYHIYSKDQIDAMFRQGYDMHKINQSPRRGLYDTKYGGVKAFNNVIQTSTGTNG
jgi:hypothetical protein